MARSPSSCGVLPGRSTRLPKRCAGTQQPSAQCCPFIGVQGVFDHYPSCGGTDSRSWDVWTYPTFSSPAPFGELYELSGSYTAGANDLESDDLYSYVNWAITNGRPNNYNQARGVFSPGSGALFIPHRQAGASGYPNCVMNPLDFSTLLRFPAGNWQLYLVGMRELGPLGFGAAGGWFEITRCRRLHSDPLITPQFPVVLRHLGPSPEFSAGRQRLNGNLIPMWCPYVGRRTMWRSQTFIKTDDFRGKRIRVHATVSGQAGDTRFEPITWQQPFRLSIDAAVGRIASTFPVVTRSGGGCATWSASLVFDLTVAANLAATRQALVAEIEFDNAAEQRLEISQIEVTNL